MKCNFNCNNFQLYSRHSLPVVFNIWHITSWSTNYSPEPTNHQRTTQRAKSKPWSWWDSYPTPPNTHPIPEWHRRAWRWGHERAGLRQRDSFVGGAILTPASWGLPWIWRRRGWPRRLGLRGMMRRRWLKRASWSVVVLMINWKWHALDGWHFEGLEKIRERESRIFWISSRRSERYLRGTIPIIFAFPISMDLLWFTQIYSSVF